MTDATNDPIPKTRQEIQEQLGEIHKKLENCAPEEYDSLLDKLNALSEAYFGTSDEIEAKLALNEQSKTQLLRLFDSEVSSTLFARVRTRLLAGDDPNAADNFGETPLRAALRRNRFDVIELLVKHGADTVVLGWNLIHHAILTGDLASIKSKATRSGLSARSRDDLTPYLLACAIGNLEIASHLLQASRVEDLQFTLPAFPPPNNTGSGLYLAAFHGHLALVKQLLADGQMLNMTASNNLTALGGAVEGAHPKIVRYLLSQGADVTNINPVGDVLSVEETDEAVFQQETRDRYDIAQMLLQAGVTQDALITNDMVEEDTWALGCLTGAVMILKHPITKELFSKEYTPIFGTANPQEIDRIFYKEMIRTGESGFSAYDKYGSILGEYPTKPTWSFARFGMTTTQLPDGRWVQIAGEHEDYYDDDFNIYNDVIVHDGKGGVTVYGYPEQDFPPTDFHTATLVGDQIILVGSLGYPDKIDQHDTQVMALVLRDFSIQKIDTSGSKPGWLNRHHALLKNGHIEVWGGQKISTDGELTKNTGRHTLNLANMVWNEIGT